MRCIPTGLPVPSLLMGLAAAACMAAPAASASDPPGANQCFYVNQIRGNSALDQRTVLFRVNVKDVYRLDFAQTCPALSYPNPKLIITPFGGIGLVCHAIDLDVKVGEQSPGSFPMACITKSLRKLTPAEVAAIPKKKLP
ncbi:MAG: DUF6491 family protein [Caulobacteraceae bacterium]